MIKVWCRVTPHFIFLFTSSVAEVIADWESNGNVQEFAPKISLFSAVIAKTYRRRISSCRSMSNIILPSYLIMACCKWASLCRKRYIQTGPCMSHALRTPQRCPLMFIRSDRGNQNDIGGFPGCGVAYQAWGRGRMTRARCWVLSFLHCLVWSSCIRWSQESLLRLSFCWQYCTRWRISSRPKTLEMSI